MLYWLPPYNKVNQPCVYICIYIYICIASLLSLPRRYSWASPVAHLVKNLPAMHATWVWSLGWEDPLEKGKATHSSILAWRIPWTVQSTRLQRVRHYWTTFFFTFLEPPSQLLHPTPLGLTEHKAELPVLCSSFPLAIYFAHGSVYISMLLFKLVPPSPSSSVPPSHGGFFDRRPLDIH